MVPEANYIRFPSETTPPAVSNPVRQDEEASIPYYPDTGCTFSPSCLSCSLHKCAYDMTSGELAQVRASLKPQNTHADALVYAVQDLEVLGLTRGKAIKMVAQREGVSVRTVFRRISSPDRPVIHRVPGLKAQTVRRLVHLMDDGVTRADAVRQLAAEYGTTPGIINRRIREAGKENTHELLPRP